MKKLFFEVAKGGAIFGAVVNKGGAMETETISKHGRKSKSQMSRGNFLEIKMKKSVFSMIMAVAIFYAAYGQVENPISDNQQMIIPGKGVSQELLTEFQKIFEKFSGKSEEISSILDTQSNLTAENSNVCKENVDSKFYTLLSDEEQNRMFVIYVQMDDKQRKEQKIQFVSPVFSSSSSVFPKPHSPHELQLKFWNDPSQFPRERDGQRFEIWIDGVKVENNALNSYKTIDFAGYFVSVLHVAEKDKDYQFRVNLWTITGYKDFCEKYFDKPVSIDKLLEIKPRIKIEGWVQYENIMFQDGSTWHGFMMFAPKE